MRSVFLVFLAPLALLGGCAGGPSSIRMSGSDIESGVGQSAYGMFLAGEGALNDGRTREAGIYFDRAAAELPDAMLQERAFTAALLAGDVTRAAALAPVGEGATEGAVRLGRLVIAVEALSTGKAKLAQEQFAGESIGFPHRAAALLLAPWAAAAAGDVEGSLVRPVARADRLAEYFGQLGQAHLFERTGRYDEAETDFKALVVGEAPAEIAVLAYGAFLERRGRRPEAMALYDKSLATDSDSPAIRAARARAVDRKPPSQPTVREGAAQALLPSAVAMINAKQNQLALAYVQMILRLDPARDDVWVMLGDIMSSDGDVEAARAAYARPKPESTDYVAARAKLAWSYQGAKDTETALKLARDTAAGGDPDARLTLADLLRANEQHLEAAELISQLITEAKAPDWRLLYARGVNYERLNRWPEAERDLEAALALDGDEPELLNYLGYSWIDRGLRLKEGLALVEKAVAANPRSGAMTDSLGWAYYRMGDFKRAVELLEAAVELDAGEPEINSHLGDVYWRVGRRDEAVFQWRRVLTLDPDEKIRADAEAKLKSGLDHDGPAASPRVAGK